MKDEPTPEMIAMARRVINENSDYMRGLDGGQRFFSAEEVLRIALAALAHKDVNANIGGADA